MLELAQPWTTPPPTATDRGDQLRQEHTRLRVRMLTGGHRDDIKRRARECAGDVRAEAWGPPDLSCGVLSEGARALATLYDPDLDEGDATPTVESSDDPTAGAAMAEVLDAGGIWPLMPRVQAHTIALREMLVRVDVDGTDEAGRPQIGYRPVTPDLVEAVPDRRDPQRPIEIRELRWRTNPDTGAEEWTRELWSLEGGGRHQVLDVGGRDISERWGLPKGGQVGDAYPVRTRSGEARLPYVLHHAELTGALWDPYTLIQVVDGTLTCSVWWTYLGHVLRNAAFALRYGVNVEPVGAHTIDPKTATARQVVIADPAVMNRFQSIDPDGDIDIGQLGATADPAAIAATIEKFERRLHAMMGLDPADAARISGDPRSGFALEVSRQSKEVHALRYAPTFARSDAAMVALTAILYNRAAGLQVFPESGWSVVHAPIRAIRRRTAAARAPAPAAPTTHAS